MLRRGAILLAGLWLVGCGGENPPQRDCFARVWVPTETGGEIVGTWDGFAAPIAAEPYDAAWNLARFELPPGAYGYWVVQAGRRTIDPYNPLTTYDGDDELSLLQIPDCTAPRLLVDQSRVVDDQVEIEARFLAAEDASPLDPEAVSAIASDGTVLSVAEVDPALGRLVLRGPAPPVGKLRISIDTADEDGVRARTETAQAWVGGRDLRDEVIYQIMVDRFRGDGGAPLPTPATPGSRAGGTLDGIRSAVIDGSIEALGATTIWTSPVYLNPDAPQPGNLDGRMYEGYHGYWPLDTRTVDPRLGGEAAYRQLIDDAHGRGLKVILDVVPNHVFSDHARYQDHRDTDWFTPPGCVCGNPECPWGPNIQTCWFTPYLPDVRWQNHASAAASIDDTAFWMEAFDLDGVRVDAVPMMPRSANRRIAQRLRDVVHPAEQTLLLGEVFTGPGDLGSLFYQLGPAGLDSVFDFPLMWALQSAIAVGTGDFEPVEAILLEEEAVLEGSGSIMARILDNHDTVRFISVAVGDGFGDAWDEPASQPTDEEPYRRLGLAQAVIFTLPGMPVIYQGDEIGVAGAGDPDNRRVMPAEEELLAPQRELRETVQRLGRLRRCSDVLRRGEREALTIDPQRYAYVRRHEDREVVVVISSATVATLAPPLPGLSGQWIDVVTGEGIDPGADFEVGALSFRILLRPDDPCLGAW